MNAPLDHRREPHIDEAWVGPTAVQIDGSRLIHVVIDLISALVAHAEAAKRWATVGGREESRICVLTQRLVVDALRMSEEVRTPAAVNGDGRFSPRCRSSIIPLRAGAGLLVAELRHRGDDAPGLQDALQIVALVRRLDMKMSHWPKRTRLPVLLPITTGNAA